MYRMIKTMGWYKSSNLISQKDFRQVGLERIVRAHYEVPVGELWTQQAVLERQSLVERHRLTWCSIMDTCILWKKVKTNIFGYFLVGWLKGLAELTKLQFGFLETFKKQPYDTQ